MQVLMTEIDYHYFKQGELALAYQDDSPRDLLTDSFRKINIMKNEVVKDLPGNRLILKKAV